MNHRGLPSSPQSGRWRANSDLQTMTTGIAHLRAQACLAQGGLCYYCGFKMCVNEPDTFARSYKISARQLRQVRCTAEHLTARQDGGTDTRANIAAVCWRCNKLRHARKTPMLPDLYRDYVLRRISRGGWHDRSVLINLRPAPVDRSIQDR